MSADALKALFHPFETGTLPDPGGGRVLFLNAQVCPGLSLLNENTTLLQQYFRPWAKKLEATGLKTSAGIPETQEAFDLVLLHGARQHQENLYYMARGLRTLKAGGRIVIAAANDAGGKRLVKDAALLGLPAHEESKYRCRVVWAERPERLAPAVEEVIAAGSVQPVREGFLSQPGIFSWDRIDEGSALLSSCLPGSLSGRGADFGCGYGYLSSRILKAAGDIGELWCLDADWRAVDCCRVNCGSLPFVHAQWVDIRDKDEKLPSGLDWIVMNPPFHEGKATRTEAGRDFIERAAGCLRQGGSLWLVANAHLPYEEGLNRLFARWKTIKGERGYKIIWAEK